MDIRDYVAFETERQSGTVQEAIGMYEACMLMRKWSNVHPSRRKSFEAIIHSLIKFINRTDGYRKMPVVFNHGLPAISAGLVPNAMSRLCLAMDSDYQDPSMTDLERANFYTREFLLIHPFADGNGRVGSIIWNYWMSTLDNPEPMPYFFGYN